MIIEFDLICDHQIFILQFSKEEKERRTRKLTRTSSYFVYVINKVYYVNLKYLLNFQIDFREIWETLLEYIFILVRFFFLVVPRDSWKFLLRVERKYELRILVGDPKKVVTNDQEACI